MHGPTFDDHYELYLQAEAVRAAQQYAVSPFAFFHPSPMPVPPAEPEAVPPVPPHLQRQVDALRSRIRAVIAFTNLTWAANPAASVGKLLWRLEVVGTDPDHIQAVLLCLRPSERRFITTRLIGKGDPEVAVLRSSDFPYSRQ